MANGNGNGAWLKAFWAHAAIWVAIIAAMGSSIGTKASTIATIDARYVTRELYNADIGERESVRIFPLSNWTELDVWQYIKMENIPIVPLYYSQVRRTIELNGVIIPCEHTETVDPTGKLGFTEDDIKEISCRFRSLGCIPCTGAVKSEATCIDDIIEEVLDARRSERENRIIDLTSDSSMEQKKREGYF